MEGLLKEHVLHRLQDWIGAPERIMPNTHGTIRRRRSELLPVKPLGTRRVLRVEEGLKNELNFEFYGKSEDFSIFEKLMRRFTGPPSNFRTPDRFFLMDPHGQFLACASHEKVNPILSPERWVGRTIQAVFSPTLAKQLQICLDSTLHTSTEQDLIFMIKRSAQKFRVFERFLAISDRQVAVFAWDTDVVEGKKA